MKTTLRYLMGAAALLLSLQAPGHRGHAVWTDVTWSGDSFEIVHRIHLADAIAVNRFMGGREAIEELRSLARVALYIEERFVVLGMTADSPSPAVTTLGAEIEDDFLFVYQEWSTTLPSRFPTVDNSVLLDIEPLAQAFIKIIGPGIDEERERS